MYDDGDDVHDVRCMTTYDDDGDSNDDDDDGGGGGGGGGGGDAEIQFVSAYNRSGRQEQSIALKSPLSLRRRIPGSPSSPRRSIQNDRGQ